jgi:hypothetical protein
MVPLDIRQGVSYIGPQDAPMKAGAWYLAAREVGKDAVRTYRLASVLALTVGTRSFTRPRAFDLVRYWQESAARFEAELRPMQARVRESPRAMRWLHHARTKFVPCPARSPQPAVAGNRAAVPRLRRACT